MNVDHPCREITRVDRSRPPQRYVAMCAEAALESPPKCAVTEPFRCGKTNQESTFSSRAGGLKGRDAATYAHRNAEKLHAPGGTPPLPHCLSVWTAKSFHTN